MKDEKKQAREIALFILNSLDERGETLDTILEEVFSEDALLSKQDRALAYALVYGVLRWRGRLDWIIRHFSKAPLKKISPDIMNILRIGLFQMTHLNRIPVSAAVNTSVEMAKSCGASWTVRFVNGILRNVAREYETVPFPDMEKDPISALAARKAFPKWLVRRWLNRLGTDETQRLCDAINTIPPITIRANTLKVTRESLLKSLEPDVGTIQPTPCSGDGIWFLHPKIPIPEMSAFKKGWFQVQDEAAQLVTRLLDPQRGHKVLDVCAGFGGKTGHIAQLMKNQGQITAIDRNEEKLGMLKGEMRRIGVSIVQTVTHDLYENVPRHLLKASFDRVLFDAPCSGLGVLRRNPDAKWYVSEDALVPCQKRQIRFLDALAPLVRPSGMLVYAVCSTEPEENEKVADAFLKHHPEFQVRKADLTAYSLPLTPYLKTSPHVHAMDGFFGVCFRRVK